MPHDKIDIPLDKPSEDEKLSRSEERSTESINNALFMLNASLSRKFQEYASNRYTKEQEWVQAERQYSGLLDVDDDKKLRALNSSSRSGQPPVVNITRQKTNIATARMQDIQFPLGGDYNFTVEPTEVPELQKALSNDTPIEPEEPQGVPGFAAAPQTAPQQAQIAPPPAAPLQNTQQAPQEQPQETVADVAKNIIFEAHEAAHAMQNQIRDRLTEADYGKKARNSMDDLCRLGTAVIKGPVHRLTTDRIYRKLPTSDGGTVDELTLSERTIPTVQWVDPRLVYVDPDARPGTDVEDLFELHLLTAKKLAKLAKNPAFMKERIRDVLTTDPDSTDLGSVIHQLSLTGSLGSALGKRYVVKEYHGPVDKEVLFELGVISEEEKEDVLAMYHGEVWFCNNHVIRVSLSPLESDDRVPYFFCTWEDDKSSVYGHGIPYLMRHSQRVVNSSWLMLLDNAGLTAGPQIVLNREMIRPAAPEEGWRIEPMKVWFMTEYGANVNEAMQFVNVPTQQEAISNITELAMQFADIESSIPQIQQGDIPQGNNTLGGVAMVLTASHIIQQRVSERWDDHITVPLIKRFYDWEMQYNEDDNMRRGDLNVKVGGATERIDKQVKAQDIERIMGLAGSDPEFKKHVDANMAFRELAATTRAGDIIVPMDVVKRLEEEEAAAAEQAGPDPETLKAQAAMLSAETKAKDVEVRSQLAQQQMQLDAQLQQSKLENESMKLQATQQEGFIKVQLAQMDRELKLIELAAKGEISQIELAQKLNIAVMTETTKRLLKEADIEQFREELTVKRQMGTGI